MSKRPVSRRRLVDVPVAVAVAGLAVGLAGCSSGSSLPSPGTGSPTAAVSGFLQDLASGNTSGACGYALPSQQATCTGDFSKAVIKITGLAIGNDIVVGNEALVVVEGTACFGATTASTICSSNNSANADLPTAANFATTYAANFNNNNSSDRLEAAYEQDSQWYVVDALPSGSTGATGSTTPSTTGTTGSTTTSTTGATGSTTPSTTGTTGATTPSSTGTTGTN